MINCDECRELISCMIDDELSEQQERLVREHIADCPECRRVYEAFCTVSEQMRRTEPLPDGLHEKIMSGIKAKPKKKARIVWLKALSAAACLALVIFAGAKSGIFTPADDSSEDEMLLGGTYEQSVPSAVYDASEITLSDDDDVLRLKALLEPSSREESDTQVYSDGEPSYTVILPDGETVFIYIDADGETVYADRGDGLFTASGTADEFEQLLNK